jgi:hypothetical protein
MRKHKSIFNKLTKKELVHLIEKGSEQEALREFKILRAFQKKGDSSGVEACFECKHIAQKLGIE